MGVLGIEPGSVILTADSSAHPSDTRSLTAYHTCFVANSHFSFSLTARNQWTVCSKHAPSVCSCYTGTIVRADSPWAMAILGKWGQEAVSQGCCFGICWSP